jgi:hypothetical protein
MVRTKKTRVQIKRERTSLGWAYRIYMGAGLTQASAREGTKANAGQAAGKEKALK